MQQLKMQQSAASKVDGSLISFVEVSLALNDAQVGCLGQAPSGNREQVVNTPAQWRSSIGKAVQHIAIHIHPPQQGREVVHFCLQTVTCVQ